MNNNNKKLLNFLRKFILLLLVVSVPIRNTSTRTQIPLRIPDNELRRLDLDELLKSEYTSASTYYRHLYTNIYNDNPSTALREPYYNELMLTEVDGFSYIMSTIDYTTNSSAYDAILCTPAAFNTPGCIGYRNILETKAGISSSTDLVGTVTNHNGSPLIKIRTLTNMSDFVSQIIEIEFVAHTADDQYFELYSCTVATDNLSSSCGNKIGKVIVTDPSFKPKKIYLRASQKSSTQQFITLVDMDSSDIDIEISGPRIMKIFDSSSNNGIGFLKITTGGSSNLYVTRVKNYIVNHEYDPTTNKYYGNFQPTDITLYTVCDYPSVNNGTTCGTNASGLLNPNLVETSQLGGNYFGALGPRNTNQDYEYFNFSAFRCTANPVLDNRLLQVKTNMFSESKNSYTFAFWVYMNNDYPDQYFGLTLDGIMSVYVMPLQNSVKNGGIRIVLSSSKYFENDNDEYSFNIEDTHVVDNWVHIKVAFMMEGTVQDSIEFADPTQEHHIKSPINTVIKATYRKIDKTGTGSVENFFSYGFMKFMKDDLGRTILPSFSQNTILMAEIHNSCYDDGLYKNQVLIVREAVIFNDFVLSDFQYQ